MWRFSNLNSGWPPDQQQQLNPNSLVFPAYTNAIGCFSRSSSTPFHGFGVQGSPINLNSEFISPLNSQLFKPANGSSGLNASAPTKRLLVFDHSGDQKGLKFSSVADPFPALNPTPPSSNASFAFASDFHGSDIPEEMHEDTEEIDALLYSDTECSVDSEEASTGHSPLNMGEDEEIAASPIPAKRRKLDLNQSAIDESLVDTASSAGVSNSPQTVSDDTSYVDSGRSNIDESSKQERIQTIIKVLKRIIPGGDAMDTATVLDEAILYLKSLKLQASRA